MLNMDNYYQNNNLLKTTREASILGVALMLSLVLFAMLREFLITGGVFHDWHLLVPGGSDIDGISQSPGEWLRPVRLHPAGFILLGLLIALGNWLGIWQKTPLDHREESPVRRARVSGVLKKED